MKRSSPLDTTNYHYYSTSEKACGCDGFFSHCKTGANLPKKPHTEAAASGVATLNTAETESFLSPLNIARNALEASNLTNLESPHELLAREMNKMTIEERNQVYDDVHGVSQPVSEDEELIAQKLCEFEAEILNQTRRREITETRNQHYRRALSSYASVYMQAEEQSKEFVEDRKRRLSFLRADNFDAKKAAVRFMKYLEDKLIYFGAEKLAKNITLEDLDEEDRTLLASGMVQILPTRDRAGRAVIFANYYDWDTWAKLKPSIRITLFMLTTLAEDEETQKNGVIIVVFCMGKRFELDQQKRLLIRHGCKSTSLMPIRTAGIQFCCEDAFVGTVLPLFMLGLGSYARARFRFHKGTLTECRFGLMTFGIPVHALPVGNDGKTKCGNHLKWIERRWQLEDIRRSGGDPSSIGMYLPSRYDVLLGRGKPCQDYPGNQRFRSFVAMHKERYKGAKKRGEKTVVADLVVQMVKSNHGRFLERDDKKGSGWYEVSDLVAREKVCHALRCR